MKQIAQSQQLFYEEKGPFGMMKADVYACTWQGSLMWEVEPALVDDIRKDHKDHVYIDLRDQNGMSVFNAFVPNTADLDDVKEYVMLLIGALAEEV